MHEMYLFSSSSVYFSISRILIIATVIDPYVIVRLYDVKKPGGRTSSLSGTPDWLDITERKTSSVRDNGFFPQWRNSEPFEFSVNQDDVAMLEFIVMDSDTGFIDDTMCKSAVPVSCLRQGLRCVQFCDQGSAHGHGPFGMARILVHVDIKYDV